MVIKSLPVLASHGLDVRYALIGIGEDLDYLSNLAQELGVTERVHFLGHVIADDLPRWYNACDVFAMPNREINGDNEGFGMVFLEAAACGKPVLAGIAGGTGAAVLDGITGFRINGSESIEVSNALIYLLTDQTYTLEMGLKAQHRACERFAWDVVASNTYSLQISANYNSSEKQ
jgi:phosphatidylinositol alpha-1,6-mannosyltransferase